MQSVDPRRSPPPDEEIIKRFQVYVTTQYHKPADEYDAETWDMAGIVQDAKIFFHTGYSIAMDDRFPNWYLSNEFRALRDEMLLGGAERRHIALIPSVQTGFACCSLRGYNAASG